MIARLRGTLVEKQPASALIEAGGLGYEVAIPYTTFYHLPEPGQEVTLQTHLVVREDEHALFGFSARGDRDLFRLLIRTSGVGPKLALAILSGLAAEAFVQVVEENNAAALVRIPGIGKKTAERLLIEMRDRIKQWERGPTVAGAGAVAVEPQTESPREEAESALIALGYKPQEAARAVNAVGDEGLSSQELIRLALKGMLKS